MRAHTLFTTLVAALSCVWNLGDTQFVDNGYEFENIGRDQDPDRSWVWRSQAAELKTLRLDREEKKTVILTLCSSPADPNQPVIGYIDNIRYANDGPADDVSVTINGVPIASFTTIEHWNWGHQWNVIRDTGSIGRRFSMVSGRYRLRLRARTDQYGVELDSINVKTLNQNPEVPLICRARFGDQ